MSGSGDRQFESFQHWLILIKLSEKGVGSHSAPEPVQFEGGSSQESTGLSITNAHFFPYELNLKHPAWFAQAFDLDVKCETSTFLITLITI